MQLERVQMPFLAEDDASGADRIPRVRFSIPCDLACGFTLRADYVRRCALLRCRNVAMLGLASYVIPAAELTDITMEELGKAILGMPSTLANFRNPDEF